MKTFTQHAITTVAVFILIGCQSNPPVQPVEQVKVTGFTPFGVAGGYDVGSLGDYSNQNYKTLFTSEYIEQNAKSEAKNALHKLFHTPLIPISPHYNDDQKRQFIGAIKHTLLSGGFNLSDSAQSALNKINKIDIAVESAVKKTATAPEELQYKIIEAIPSRGGTIVGIASKAGMAKTAVAITSILAFNRATVTIYFDSSVSSNARMEIFDKIHFDGRVAIKLGSMKNNSIMIEYTKPTIVAFKGYEFDTQSAHFYRKNGRLPTPEESLAISTAKQQQKQKQAGAAKAAAYNKTRSVNDSDLVRPFIRQ